jgi:hypothetical protein
MTRPVNCSTHHSKFAGIPAVNVKNKMLYAWRKYKKHSALCLEEIYKT